MTGIIGCDNTALKHQIVGTWYRAQSHPRSHPRIGVSPMCHCRAIGWCTVYKGTVDCQTNEPAVLSLFCVLTIVSSDLSWLQTLYFSKLYIKNGTSYGARTRSSTLLKAYRFVQYACHLQELAPVQLHIYSLVWALILLDTNLGDYSSTVMHRSNTNLW